ncbi:hypothetical protein Tco_1293283 [Tanacetum coccineum]
MLGNTLEYLRGWCIEGNRLDRNLLYVVAWALVCAVSYMEPKGEDKSRGQGKVQGMVFGLRDGLCHGLWSR